MSTFTSEDAINRRFDPLLKGQAIGLFARIAWLLGLAFLAVGITIGVLGKMGDPVVVVLWLSILGGAGVAVGAALAVQFGTQLGRPLQRLGLPIFLGALLGIVLLVWGFALVFDVLDTMMAAQDEAAVLVQTAYDGPLTIAELQSALLTDAAIADGRSGPDGLWSSVAYLLWIFQFGLVRDVIGVCGALGFVNMVAMFAIWWERKVAGRIQSRLGPMRVGGWHGWAQSMADGLKLVQKEDLTPDDADKLLFKIAPYLAFVPVFSAFIALPFGAGWVVRDLDVALLFIFAMLGIDVVGVILGGWASNNKWSTYGAMRVAGQMVSYEIPMGMSLLIPVMTVGTMQLSLIGGEIQSGGFHTWLAFSNPFVFMAAFTFFVSSLASCKRSPFDLPEAESELVAGFHTEYSGFRWALFFFAEYAGMFIISGLTVILFFGGWHSPLPASWAAGWADGAWWQQILDGLLFSGPLWFIAKGFFFIFLQIWLRWTLPRVRIDQVMYACIQVLLPMSMVLLLGNTFWQLLVPADGLIARGTNVVLTLIGAGLVIGFVVIMLNGYMNRRRLVGSLAVDHLPGS